MRARRLRTLAAMVGVAMMASILGVMSAPATAAASRRQTSIIEDSIWVKRDPARTLATFRALGVTTVRVIVVWAQVAPGAEDRTPPAGFDAADPADYPAANWAQYDAIVKDAAADGIGVDFTLSGGAPRWAEGPRIPPAALDNPFWAWRPSAGDFGQFVRAVGERYSGSYVPPGQTRPLPRVSFWAIWNEPNFGEDLGPQAIRGSTVSVAPSMYRGLVRQAWNALHATGHGGDTILIGEFAPRGMSGRATRGHPQGLPGDFAQTRPLKFIRTLYCVNSAYRPLRGRTARAEGCPPTAAGSRKFRRANPALFHASGFSDHPYPKNKPPTVERSRNPDIAPFPRIANLERTLDRVQRVYRSRRRFAIYNTEFGYITHPPNPPGFVSPASAAYYLNWAEYLSWKQRRVASTMQYLLYDPADPRSSGGVEGGFASGLLFADGRPKPTLAAFRLPLYLPATSTRRGRALQVWGCIRPARYAILDTGQAQTAQIEFRRGSRGPYVAVRSVTVSNPNNCYFDVRMRFPASGRVRLAYNYPPATPDVGGSTVYSRTVAVRLR